MYIALYDVKSYDKWVSLNSNTKQIIYIEPRIIYLYMGYKVSGVEKGRKKKRPPWVK